MKNTVLKNLAFICLITLFASCTVPKAETEKNDRAHSVLRSRADFRVSSVHFSLEQARKNVFSYDSICRITLHGIPVRAYTVRALDLIEVLGLDPADTSLCKFKHARAYLGFDSKGQFKLYLTPVVGADLDKEPLIPGRDTILRDDAGEFVLDLNAPCPMTCDKLSPLYGGEQ
jgi:hypothetical protein